MPTNTSEWETVVSGVEAAKEDEWETVSFGATDGLSPKTTEPAFEPKKEEPSLVQSILSGAYKGITNPLTTFGAGSSQAQGTFAGAFPTQPELETTPSKMGAELFGVKPKQGDLVSRTGYAAAEAVTDPLSYIGGGGFLSAVPRIGTVGGTAEVTGELGAVAEKAVTGKEGWLGRTAGALVGGTGVGLATAPTKIAVGGAANVVKQIHDKYKQVRVDPAAAENAVAAGSAKRLLEHAVTAQGASKIDDVVADINKAMQYLNKEDAPLLISMAENPVIKEQIIRLVKSNPEYRAQIQKELEKVATQIDAKASKIFGARYVGAMDTGLNISNATKRIQSIDDRLSKLTDPISKLADRSDTGAAIENLVTAKKAIAKSEQSVRYNNLKAAARTEGVSMSTDASKELYNFFRINRVRDIFGKGTATEQKVMSILKKGEDYKEMSFDDVDSLKRLINDQQRKIKDPAQLNTVNQFEEVFNSVRDKHLPEKFNNALKEIDTAYYTNVGVPFGAQGIKDIDSAKYASMVAPVVVKNKDSLRQFLSAVGPEGTAVAENAILSKAYQQTVKEGVFDVKALSSFIKKNEDILGDLPAAKKVLTDSLVDSTILRNSRAKLDVAAKAAQKRVADNYLTTTDIPDYNTMLNSVLGSSQARVKVLKNISDLSPEAAEAVRSSLRAELSNKVLTSGQGMAFLADPKNKAGIEAIMGSGYQQSLKKLAVLSDELKKIDVNKFSIAISQAQVDAVGKVVPGLDLPYLTSTIRDRISSNTQKAVRLLSRINTTRVGTKFDAQVMELLTDPKGVEKLSNVAQSLNFSIKTPVDMKKISEALANSLPANVYISLQSTEQEE